MMRWQAPLRRLRRATLMDWRPLLSILALVVAVDARASDFFGPIRIRDLSPMSSLRLDMMPPHACHDDDWNGAVRVDVSEANVFILTDNVGDFLKQRNSAKPLTQADVQELMAGAKGDVFFYDAELTLVDTEYIRRIDDRWYARLEWPLLTRSGGAMDRGIESFHNAVGLNAADRDLVSRNDVHIVARIGGEELVMLDRGSRTSTGDPVAAVGFTREVGRRLFFVGETALKVPLGDRRLYFSSGKADVGAQIALQKFFRANAIYAGANYVWTGKTTVLQSFTMSNAWTAGAAWELRFRPRSWFLMQGTWSGGAMKPKVDDTFTGDRIQVAAGVRHLFGRSFVTTVALTENLVHFKTTPDFGVHLAVAWLIPNHQQRRTHG